MKGRTRPCDEAVAEGRLRKAEQFWEAAEITREFADDEAEVGDAYEPCPELRKSEVIWDTFLGKNMALRSQYGRVGCDS